MKASSSTATASMNNRMPASNRLQRARSAYVPPAVEFPVRKLSAKARGKRRAWDSDEAARGASNVQHANVPSVSVAQRCTPTRKRLFEEDDAGSDEEEDSASTSSSSTSSLPSLSSSSSSNRAVSPPAAFQPADIDPLQSFDSEYDEAETDWDLLQFAPRKTPSRRPSNFESLLSKSLRLLNLQTTPLQAALTPVLPPPEFSLPVSDPVDTPTLFSPFTADDHIGSTSVMLQSFPLPPEFPAAPSANCLPLSQPMVRSRPIANSSHLRMLVLEFNMMRCAKLVCPLRNRGYYMREQSIDVGDAEGDRPARKRQRSQLRTEI